MYLVYNNYNTYHTRIIYSNYAIFDIKNNLRIYKKQHILIFIYIINQIGKSVLKIKLKYLAKNNRNYITIKM